MNKKIVETIINNLLKDFYSEDFNIKIGKYSLELWTNNDSLLELDFEKILKVDYKKDDISAEVEILFEGGSISIEMHAKNN